MPRGAGFEFVNSVKGGAIPTSLIPAVQKGVEQVLTSGPLAGFPLQDVRVNVYDGKYHPVDSKEVAFVSAGRKAFLDAIAKARPIVLEPVVGVEINCPAVNMGDVTGDLSSRRGQVTGTKTLQAGTLAVTGLAPLGELEGYAARLRSMTGGQGAWSMELSHYEQAPPRPAAATPLPSTRSIVGTRRSDDTCANCSDEAAARPPEASALTIFGACHSLTRNCGGSHSIQTLPRATGGPEQRHQRRQEEQRPHEPFGLNKAKCHRNAPERTMIAKGDSCPRRFGMVIRSRS